MSNLNKFLQKCDAPIFKMGPTLVFEMLKYFHRTKLRPMAYPSS